MVTQPIKILIVDDHAMVRKGLRLLLDGLDETCVIGEAANGLLGVEMAKRLEPDVVLMDLDMPVMDGIEAIRRIIRLRPDQHIIVLTGYVEKEKMLEAVQAGAQGYIGKTVDTKELVQSIQDVYGGKPSLDRATIWQALREFGRQEPAHEDGNTLTEREMEILRLLTQGKRDQEIARELVITDVTVRTHISRILFKLHVKNRVQAALYGIRAGLVSVHDVHIVD